MSNTAYCGVSAVKLTRRVHLWFLLPALAASLSIKLPSGDYVQGEQHKSASAQGTVFYGIRYAMPQGPHNRFMRAEPYEKGPNSPPIQFSKPLPTCGTDNQTTFSEDCLHLSIWQPKGTMRGDAKLRPVLVHIHPGALHKLSPTFGNYDWMHMAAQTGTVLVGMSFRLAIFGHYVSEELDEEQNGRVGNSGFLDQRLALEWIQRNIKLFGGDASRVTLFGLSSGALACVWHSASPGSSGLFHGCVAESGPGGENYYQAKPDAFRFWRWYSETFLGCSSLACMRALDATALNAFIGNESLGFPDWGPGTFPAFPYGGMVDGTDIVAYPLTTAREGACAALNCSIGRVPVIFATAAEECHSFLPRVVNFIPALAGLPGPGNTNLKQAVGKEHVAGMADWFAGWQRREEVMDLACDMYPGWWYESGGDALSYMYRDQRYSCPQLRIYHAWNSPRAAAAGSAPAYFIFNQRGKRGGRFAMHGWLYEGVLELTPRSTQLLCYWAGLAHGGDPNSRPAVDACNPPQKPTRKGRTPPPPDLPRLPSSLDSAEGISYLLVPRHDSEPLRAHTLPAHYSARGVRDPPTMDVCAAWEAWHGGSKALFLPHAELRRDSRPRLCNASAATAPKPEL